MTAYTALATAIKTTLWADSWIDEFPNIKVIESNRREPSLQGAGAMFFKESEVPFIVINPKVSGKNEVTRTVTRPIESIPVELLVVSGNSDVKTADKEHKTIGYNIDRVLDNQNLPGQGFGVFAFIVGTSRTTSRFKKGKVFYYQSKFNFSVELNG